MLSIDYPIFLKNLRLTQECCYYRAHPAIGDPAITFRTFNPDNKGLPLYSFETVTMREAPGYYIMTQWTIDPLSEQTQLVERLFRQQLRFKERHYAMTDMLSRHGDILVTAFRESVVDGASEAASLGFIDAYDLPPIDTWFYIAHNNAQQLLFSWVPEAFRHHANEGIAVNCVDCFNWFREWHPQEHAAFEAYGKGH